MVASPVHVNTSVVWKLGKQHHFLNLYSDTITRVAYIGPIMFGPLSAAWSIYNVLSLLSTPIHEYHYLQRAEGGDCCFGTSSVAY